MKKFLWAFFFVAALFCHVSAQEPTVTAGDAGDEIMIPDGRLTEKFYQKAAWYSLPHSLQTIPQKTDFTVLRQPNGLWFAFKIIDREIVSNKKEDDGPLWADDCLEIFLVTEHAIPEDPNAREFYHFIFNADGFRYDARNFGGVAQVNWNSNYKVATQRSDDGFTAEVFIPYAGMNLNENENVWRINVGREDRLQQKVWLSSLTACRTFNETTSFARLLNAAPDFRRFNVKSARPVINMVSSNQVLHPAMNIDLSVPQQEDLQFTGVLRDKTGAVRALSHCTGRAGKDGRITAKLVFPPVAEGIYTVSYMVADNLGTVFSDSFQQRIETSSWRLNMLNPVYRNTLFASQQQRNISFETVPLTDRQQVLEIKLINSSDQIIYDQKQNFTSRQKVEIPSAELPPGTYTLKITDSKNVLQEKITILPPQQGNEVTLDAAGRLLVNGQKFFPRGFIGGNFDLAPHKQANSNVIHFYELHRMSMKDIRSLLDKCHAAGLKVIMTPAYRTNMGFWGIKDGNKYRKKFTEKEIEDLKFMVNDIKSHPALLAWYLFDEPRGAAWCAELKRIYELMRQIDPAHPVVGLDNIAGGVIEKQDHCDIALLDIYPNPFVHSGPARPISMITAGAAAAVNALPPGKGFWQCTQAYDNDSFQKPDFKRERRAPTYTETRATVFGTIAVGARGIMPYKIGNASCRYFIRHGNAGIFADPEMKLGYLEGVMQELFILEPVLLADEIKVDYSGDVLLRAYTYKNHRFVIAANVKTTPAELTVAWDSATPVRVLGEKRSLTARQSKISDQFAPLAVHIYTDSPDFPETPDIEALKKRIAGERSKALSQLPPEVKDKQ